MILRKQNIILRERKHNAWERNFILRERNDILRKKKVKCEKEILNYGNVKIMRANE